MNAKQVIKILAQNGFYEVRQKGSHKRLTNGVKFTSVPEHGKKDLGIGLIKKIEKDTGVNIL